MCIAFIVDINCIRMKMLKCQDPGCGEMNPDDAKYCRKCGKPLSRISDIFTLDVFNGIRLEPVSVVHFRFYRPLMLVFTACIAIMYMMTVTNFGKNIMSLISRDLMLNSRQIGYVLLFILILCAIYLIKWTWRKVRFSLNADYIEKKNDDIVRVAKKSSLGLYSKKSMKILIPSKYSSIDKLTSEYYIVKKGNATGVYSVNCSKMIVSPAYDSVRFLSDSIIEALSGGDKMYFDIRGNKLR